MVYSNSTSAGVFVEYSGGLYRVRYWYWDANPNWVNYATGYTAFSPNVWTHVAVVNKPGASGLAWPICYINGTPIVMNALGYTPQANNAGGNTAIYIGEYSIYRPYSQFVGNIGSAKVYNRMLSQDEIITDYNGSREVYGI